MQPFKLPDFYVPHPARLNPNLNAARAHTKAWAREMGILAAPQNEDEPGIWSEYNFDRHDYALFCAYIHPEAPTPELSLMTDWNVWAFYVDDFFLKVYKQSQDRAGAKQYLDRVLLFMPVDLFSPIPIPTNPTERGLADVWLRTAPSKSKAWRARIIESTRSLLEASFGELESESRQRLSNPIEYIEMRRRVGGALWSADLVEHAMFVEVPERVANTRPMRVLKDTFADAVHLRNDIFSYQREVIKEGELTNGVLVIEHFLGLDAQRAANLVNDLLNSRLDQFDHTIATELNVLFEEYCLSPQEQSDVFDYIRGLQDWQSGSHEWHIQTSRYLNAFDTEEKCTTTTGFISGLTGLGTSAGQITQARLDQKRFRNSRHTPYQKVGPVCPPKFYMPFVPEMNPHLESARQHQKEWTRQMGMTTALPGRPGVFIWDEVGAERENISLFSSMADPYATAAELNIGMDWMLWGAYVDDYFAKVFVPTRDLASAKQCHTRLAQFMPLDPSQPIAIPSTPIERSLADLWLRTTATFSSREKRLFRRVVEDMVGSWLWELTNLIQNRIPDLIDYVEMRRITSGSGLFLFSTSIQAQGIPPEVYRTRTMQELNNAAIDYVCMTNDIVSYQREIEFEGDMHNVVFVVQRFLDCSKVQAVELVNDLMTSRMKQFEHIAAIELPILCENFDLNSTARKQLLRHVKVLQDFMCGSLHWHTTSSRYHESELRRQYRSFTGGPGGLGTSAVYIMETSSSGVVGQPTSSLPPRKEPFAVPHPALPFLKKGEVEAS